jgi:hypothetical protein
MKSRVPGLALLAFLSSAFSLGACAATGGTMFTGTSAGTGASGGSGSGALGTGSTGVSSNSTGPGGSFAGSSGSGGTGVGGGSAGVTYAYAHTNTALYKFDPSQATLSMQLVGNFDCIGTSTTSSSGNPGVPTTCAEANGETGCCDGNTNYYCTKTGTTPSSKKCSSGQVCTWNATSSYYGCGTGPAVGPTGGAPQACSAGSGSSSSGGGATEDSSMTDIAVDSKGNLWGVSEHNAYELDIQGSTVHCAKTIPLTGVSAGDIFYALSFVPKGVIDANAETLLGGDTAGNLWRIDTTTGAIEQHGNFGVVPATDGQSHNYPSDATATGTTTTVGTPWQLSGDIVFLADTGGSPIGFATVRDCTSMGCSATDTLLQIDMTKLGKAGTAVTGNITLGLRGQVVKSSTCTDTTNATYGRMYGIAAWNSTIYGFSHGSYIVEIDNSTGAACAVGGTNTAEAWSGAAVTTIAPVHPPPPPNVQ